MHAAGRGILDALPDEPDRIVDRSWDPPGTLQVRLVSLADEACAHAGQLGYLRGLIDRR